MSDWTQRGNQCLTLFDDSSNVYDRQDLRRLERKSTVLPASEVETNLPLPDKVASAKAGCGRSGNKTGF